MCIIVPLSMIPAEMSQVDATEARKALLDGILIGDIHGLGGRACHVMERARDRRPAPVCPPV